MLVRLADELSDLFEQQGISAFVANRDIEWGEDWQERLRQALCAASEVIIILSPAALQSQWVMMELGAAWALGCRVTPALLCAGSNELPEPVRRLQAKSILTRSHRLKLVSGVAERLLG